MDQAAPRQLTNRQREALRLYYQNLSIKEIAVKLDSTPAAITERLRDARRMLGVSRSMEAARIVAQHGGYTRDVDSAGGLAADVAMGQPTPQKRSDGSTVVGANRYRFSVLQRLGIILLGAVGILALTGAVVIGVYALSYLFRAEKISIAEKPYVR